MGLGPTSFKKFMNILHSIGVPAFATVWIIAMIKLWSWNVESTSLFFAFAMIFLGFLILFLSITHTFNLHNKFKAYLKRKNKN